MYSSLSGSTLSTMPAVAVTRTSMSRLRALFNAGLQLMMPVCLRSACLSVCLAAPCFNESTLADDPLDGRYSEPTVKWSDVVHGKM